MRRLSAFAWLLCVGLSASACVSTGQIGIITRSDANPAELITEARPYRSLGPVRARACRYFALAIVPWGDNAMSTAVDEALDKSGGDALLNVTVSSSLFGFIPYYNIFSYTCTSLNGTAIRFEHAGSSAP